MGKKFSQSQLEGTGVPSRFDAPHEDKYPLIELIERPHPQGLVARGIEGNLGHETTYPRREHHDSLGSLPGGETGYPKSTILNGNRYTGMGEIPSTASQPVVVNSEGGKQSATLGRFDLIPGEALTRIAQVLECGVLPVPGVRDGYPPGNWKLISGYQHVNHALEHLAMHAMHRTDEDHLGHALTRLAFAVWAEVHRGDMHDA